MCGFCRWSAASCCSRCSATTSTSRPIQASPNMERVARRRAAGGDRGGRPGARDRADDRAALRRAEAVLRLEARDGSARRPRGAGECLARSSSGYDGSEGARAALAKAVELAKLDGSRLIVVFGCPDPGGVGRRDQRLPRRDLRELSGENPVTRSAMSATPASSSRSSSCPSGRRRASSASPSGTTRGSSSSARTGASDKGCPRLGAAQAAAHLARAGPRSPQARGGVSVGESSLS